MSAEDGKRHSNTQTPKHPNKQDAPFARSLGIWVFGCLDGLESCASGVWRLPQGGLPRACRP